MSVSHSTQTFNWVWDISTLDWIRAQQSVIATDTLNVALAGVATSAKQDTGNTSLAAINTALTDGTQRVGGVVVVSGAVLTL